MLKLPIPGPPIPLKRPRARRIGKHIAIYDPQARQKKKIALWCRQYVTKPLKDPISANMTFYITRPKSHFGTGKNRQTLKASAPLYITTKPDLDNLIKFYLDVLNGLAYQDDKQIVEIHAKKLYFDQDQTENTMIELDLVS